MILIDTDVCLEILRGNKDVIQRRRATTETVAISFMTVAELYFGAYRSDEPKHNRGLVEKFLLTVQIRHSDNQIQERFGMIKSSLQRDGQTIADADVLIAATALSNTAKLVTGNVRHYERIEGLKIENWMAQGQDAS